MFKSDPRVTGLRIEWEEVTLASGQEWNFVVKQRVEGYGWKTVALERWSGYMIDMVATASEDVASAFFFGEARDVARAVASNTKVARAHARRHDRL